MEKVNDLEIQKCRKNDVATQMYVTSEAHIKSFNFFLEDGPELILKHLPPLEIFATQINSSFKNKNEAIAVPFSSMKVWFEDLVIGMPTQFDNHSRQDSRIFPFEARISQGSYSAPLMGTICRVGLESYLGHR
jgi:DNA-directed RNA polymerase beta subunit